MRVISDIMLDSRKREQLPTSQHALDLPEGTKVDLSIRMRDAVLHHLTLEQVVL